MTTFLVTDGRRSAVVEVDTVSKTSGVTFGTQGSGDREFLQPTGICRQQGGGYLVADRGNDRIAAFDDLDGNGWRTFGTSGSGVGQLSGPTDVALGVGGSIYIADCGNRRIVKIDDLDGNGWSTFGTGGRPSAGDPAVGKFSTPVALAVDGGDRIYIADPDAGRVVRIAGIDGTDWVDAGLSSDPALALNGPTGVVAQTTRVVVSELAGRRLATFGTFPSGPIRRFDGTTTGIALAGPAALASDGAASFAACDTIGRLLHLEASGAGYALLADVHLGRIGIDQPVGLCEK